MAAGGQYGDLDAKLKVAATSQEKLKILENANIQNDDQFDGLVDRMERDPSAVDQAADYVDLKAMAESVHNQPDQTGRIKMIKSSPLYGDEGKRESANWLRGAVQRLQKLLQPKPRTHIPNSGPDLGDWGALGVFFIRFVWFLLGAAVLAFIIYAIRLIQFSKLKKRRAKAVLEDDEPERTLDEWLELANRLEMEGRYREAVRALYLSCLLKFDERNIARFVRSQTNWEHLARIDASPRKPTSVDFRSPTQAFDRIWYGHKIRGSADVDDFRGWYSQISLALLERAA